MRTLRASIGLIACLLLGGANPAIADAVTDWNATAAQTVSAAAPPRAAPLAFLDLAVVQIAVHDAVQAYENRYEPYAVAIVGATGAVDAAVAKAAYDVLANRFPAQAPGLLTTYTNYLTGKGLDPVNDGGVAVGAQAAAAIIALRANDIPNPLPPPFTGSTDVGMWRPTPSFLPGPPPSNSPMAIPWFANVTPLTLTSPSQFRPQGPPKLTSGEYTRDYDEVKRLGRDVGSERTSDQTYIALFWALNYVTQWNLAYRDIAAAHITDIADTARLFALGNMAMTDAALTAWDCKVTFPSWRPITAINEGDSDPNKHTGGDPDWKPLINTPNYPDHCSGANSVSAAGSRILALVFGTDHFEFVMTSNNAAAVPPTHTYTRFSDVTLDVRNARVYQGIHFRFADEIGRKNGLKVAKWAFHHALRPVGGGEGDCCDDEE